MSNYISKVTVNGETVAIRDDQATNYMTKEEGSALQSQIDQKRNKTDNVYPYFEIFGNPQPYIDFHYNNSAEDFTSRIIESSKGQLTINASKVLFSGEVSAGNIANLKKTSYQGLRTMDITLDYSSTYLLTLTVNSGGARTSNSMYIVSTPDSSGKSGGVTQIVNSLVKDVTINNSTITITTDFNYYFSISLLKLV